MSAAKRGGRVAPPSVFPEWMLRFGSTSAATGWETLCTQAAGNTRKAWEMLVTNPCPVPPTTRQHRLKGKLGTSVDGLPIWQYEVTGGGRIWYVVDDAKHTVYLTEVHVGHPKATE